MIPEKVQTILNKFNLQALEFAPGSTPTVHTAAEKIGVQPAQIAKSLVYKSKDGKFFMVVCPGNKRISSKALKQISGTKLSMTNPEETLKATGFLPGAVCPFGVQGVEILLDKDLGLYPKVYPAAGTDASGVPIDLETLVQASGGKIVDLNE